ncbi:MAG: hypothetical protein N3F07_02180 [Candidatus Micrarchaeota archaeon]|nr:hypothetical protein [Candidatus Micrarchaeota archaeon]
MSKIEIVPAILAKTKEEFYSKLSKVAPYVSRVQVDVMDGEFVPNKTVGIGDIGKIPPHILPEYHLMVEDPVAYAEEIGRRGAVYEIHLESFTKAGRMGGIGKNPKAQDELMEAIRRIRKMGGRVGLALSPDTPASQAFPFLGYVELVLVMTVYPGFSGQKYIAEMEPKMRLLAGKGALVEVDGGIEVGTARRAASCGAALLGAASAIFSKPDAKKAIDELQEDAQKGLQS